MPSVAEIIATEVSQPFIDGMTNRMVVSFHKYGLVARAYPDRVNALASLRQRLELYAQTGNTEFLIDAANFAMIEFMHARHPDAHFVGTDDDASPGRISLRSGQADKRDNAEIGRNYVSPMAQFRE